MEAAEQGSEKKPLAGCMRDTMRMLVKNLKLVVLLLVAIGLAIGLCLYLAQAGPTRVATFAPGPSTTPTPASPGIFIATHHGLIALNLLTLEARKLTSEPTNAVALNHILKKVYWSEMQSLIQRSNFDGSDKEVIFRNGGNLDEVHALAIDNGSGKIYFARYVDSEVIMCSSDGENCVVIMSDKSLLKLPQSITLDSENGVMYFRVNQPRSAFICVSMDGSNGTIIDGGFSILSGIALEKNSSDVMYWTEYTGAIGKIDVNGRNKRTILQLAFEAHPARIQVDDHKIYFLTNVGIQSASKVDGGEPKMIFNSSGDVLNFAIFNELV